MLASTLSGDPTQEGWDLGWDKSDFTANIKVAEDGDVILRHFQDHPDVEIIYASSDAADSVATTRINGEAITLLRPGDSWPDSEGKIVVDFGERSTDLNSDVVEFFDASATGAGDVVGELFDVFPCWVSRSFQAVLLTAWL